MDWSKTEHSELKQVIKIAQALFRRNKVSGSTANVSIRIGDLYYISGSGTSFGFLKPEHFAKLDAQGNLLNKVKPSKEWPLHQTLYQTAGCGAVLHTHSFYATLWSCLSHADVKHILPAYTPYLNMKLGPIALVPYAPPGTEELFDLFRQTADGRSGYLLGNHGPIVGGKDIGEAFYNLEELEESARIAWHLRGLNFPEIDS